MQQTKKSDPHQALLNPTETGFHCEGAWTIFHLDSLYTTFLKYPLPENQKLQIDTEAIETFDSAGAIALLSCIKLLKEKGNTCELPHIKPEQQELLTLVEEKGDNLTLPPQPPREKNIFATIGKETIAKLLQVDEFIILIGNLATQFASALVHPRKFQIASIVSVVYSAGLQALPIVGLLAFLIGIVLAYQMGLQLQTYGANIFIAWLSGMAIFREFGPLITAIIVAGRTSSSFTAQIGSMIINEEVDAIQAMGLSPIELLVMPKVIGLLFIFPILIFWADLFSIIGSMFMSKTKLGVGYEDFLTRLQDAVGLDQFMRGLYKAPAFAAIIALVGCFQGFRVQNRTDSIGIQTTKSVVQAIFLIIVADAIYSVIYSWMDF